MNLMRLSSIQGSHNLHMISKLGLDLTNDFGCYWYIRNPADVLNIFAGGDDSGLEVTSVSAPYAILVSNPNRNSANEQTDCEDSVGMTR